MTLLRILPSSSTPINNNISSPSFFNLLIPSLLPPCSSPPPAIAICFALHRHPTTSTSTPFVKPLDTLYPPAPCRFCQGEGLVACDKCDGRGFLGKGGYHKRNRVHLDRIIGSKWTAMETTFGWRHFVVVSKQKGPGKDWFLQLVATCDENTRFWVNAQNLKERERWSMGWLQRADMVAPEGKVGFSTPCKACRGDGRLRCDACEKKGLKDVGSDRIIDI